MFAHGGVGNQSQAHAFQQPPLVMQQHRTGAIQQQPDQIPHRTGEFVANGEVFWAKFNRHGLRDCIRTNYLICIWWNRVLVGFLFAKPTSIRFRR